MARNRNDDDRDDDRPRRRKPRRRNDDDDAVGSNGFATASIIFGILSFCTGITFIPGLIFGGLGLMKSKSTGVGSGMALAGILTSLGGLAVTIVVGYLAYFVYKVDEKIRQNSYSYVNYKIIIIAAHNYEANTGAFPKPYAVDPANLKPPMESELFKKLSWRVALLPYLDEKALYPQFNLGEAWDSRTNFPISQKVVAAYTDIETPLDPSTRLRCFYGKGTMFELDNAVTITSVTDGTSSTILFVEGADKVTWSQFNEYKFNPTGPLPALGQPFRNTFTVLMVDGSVREVRKSINPDVLKSAITRNDGNVISLD